MTDKPETELELSPYVISFWEDRGYCVHGEVAVFSRSIFIDHVAHTGPCENPDHVVGIEMKRGAGKKLRKQMFNLDVKHVVDELWGAVIATPRESTLEEWDGLGRWNQPGLLVWNDEKELEVYQEPAVNREYTRSMRYHWLLLIDDNRRIKAGYSSNDDDNSYLTHWSCTKRFVLDYITEHEEPVSVEELYDNLPDVTDPYSNKKATLNKVIRVLEDEENKIQLVEKTNGKKFYKEGSDSSGWEVDERFEEFFELD